MPNNKPDSQKVETPKVEAKDHSIAIGSIEVHGNVEGGIHIGNTIIQKFFNIFKSDSESLEQRNRRILLGHVENAWIKGVLDASLHGAALLDLGIKEDPEAVTQYPWAIKKESTDETLPAGTSMQEIFDSIGMGRSLLILGAPGSGKTTMLLELARQLIARAREDVTYPIPMVFNLASWTEKLSLADWLAQELNNLYSIPRKTAPDWVQGDKLLLLLDGLDEVRQESRAKCVDAINAFRKEHGLTSLAVCSRSQDYADLKAKLSFEGAIEVQPLTQKQITKFFSRFGKEMAGIKQVLKKDTALREMAETPLFLSIMIMAYRDKQDVEILVSGDEKGRRKHLFDTYIERMFERSERSKNKHFPKPVVLKSLAWLASKMIRHNQIPFLIERLQPDWLNQEKFTLTFRVIVGVFSGLVRGLSIGVGLGFLLGALAFRFFADISDLELFIKFGIWQYYEAVFGIIFGLILMFVGGTIGGFISRQNKIETIDTIYWSWRDFVNGYIKGFIDWMIFGLILAWIYMLLFQAYDMSIISGLIIELIIGLMAGIIVGLRSRLTSGLRAGVMGMLIGGIILCTFTLFLGEEFYIQVGYLIIGMGTIVYIEVFLGIILGILGGLIGGVLRGVKSRKLNVTIKPGERILRSIKNSVFSFLLTELVFVVGLMLIYSLIFLFNGYENLFTNLIQGLILGLICGLIYGMDIGLIIGLRNGGLVTFQHYTLRIILHRHNILPWKLFSLLDYAADLIFINRVGGGYIFVHRLLMEHFAEMYVESPTSMEN